MIVFDREDCGRYCDDCPPPIAQQLEDLLRGLGVPAYDDEEPLDWLDRLNALCAPGVAFMVDAGELWLREVA